MTCIYWFAHKTERIAKLGKADQPSVRLRALGRELFDLRLSTCFSVPAHKDALQVEAMAQSVIEEFRLEKDYILSLGLPESGCTEWFSLDALDGLRKFADLFKLPEARAELHTLPVTDTLLVQYNIRLTPGTRQRLRDAAYVQRISERELIERFAATLPEVIRLSGYALDDSAPSESGEPEPLT